MSFNAKNTSGILFMSKLKLTITFVIVVVSEKYWLSYQIKSGTLFFARKIII